MVSFYDCLIENGGVLSDLNASSQNAQLHLTAPYL